MTVHRIIIARSSTVRHDVTCKSQVEEIKAEVLKRGEIIVKELEFPRVRHRDFLEDPDFKDILTKVKQKNRKWSKIWFYDTSRLSRNRMNAQTTKAFFKRHGIEISFLKIPKIGDEALDNVVEGILETFDQLLSDFSRAGFIRGQKQNIRSGYRAGGRAPYGYQLNKRIVASPKSRKYLLTGLLRCGVCNGPMVGDSGYYSCIHKRNHHSECTNSKMSSEYLDKQTIKFVKETLLSRIHFEKVIEATKKAYQEEIRKTNKDCSRLQNRLIEIDECINRNMSLFERGNISPEIIEGRISILEKERADINKTLEGNHQVLTAIQYAESELNSRTIKSYVNRFEELLNETNVELIRNFIHTFIAKIELFGREGRKRKGRRLNIHGQIPSLTGIYYASPGGIEPPLQDRKSWVLGH